MNEYSRTEENRPTGGRSKQSCSGLAMSLKWRKPRMSCGSRRRVVVVSAVVFLYICLSLASFIKNPPGFRVDYLGGKEMKLRIAVLSIVAALLALPAAAADKVKIGFVTTLTTGAAVIGKDMQDAVNLAVEDIGGKMGGLDVEVIFGDDGFKPETGKQVTDKLVKSDDVDFVAAVRPVLVVPQHPGLGMHHETQLVAVAQRVDLRPIVRLAHERVVARHGPIVVQPQDLAA